MLSSNKQKQLFFINTWSKELFWAILDWKNTRFSNFRYFYRWNLLIFEQFSSKSGYSWKFPTSEKKKSFKRMFWNGLDHMIWRLESITWSSLVLIIYFCCLWSYDLVNKHTFWQSGNRVHSRTDSWRISGVSDSAKDEFRTF